MSKAPAKQREIPDREQREKALEPGRNILVQAPAGSGKTSLLTMRFLCLLGEVDDPAEIVAITFTKAAAAEMRHRILEELEKAATGAAVENSGAAKLARRAAERVLERSHERGWNLLELSAQLRIDTIDAFCREIAVQQPLLAGLGGALEIADDKEELYRRAARSTLETLGARPTENNAEVRQAVEALLVWRDNNWHELESQLAEMLEKRDRWMHGIVLTREQDWEALRVRLERPLAAAARRQEENAPQRYTPERYTEDEWQIVRHCFTLLRHAAAELQVVFAEVGAADYTEVALQAQRVLEDEDRMPTEAGLAIADGIHHLLVDEFQDTSRRQHRLIASVAAAWPDTAGRSVFAVGDPMQSIYLFRSADAELFPRIRQMGLALPDGETLQFDFVQLSANFRTAPALVEELNDFFRTAFAEPDAGGIAFAPAVPAREHDDAKDEEEPFKTHFGFESGSETQTAEIVELIRRKEKQIKTAKAQGEKYRIAVLGRTAKILSTIAAALREAGIPFRAQDLEALGGRPEVKDAVALARALLNGEDRVAWLSVLRAPWCGLSLTDLHALASADDAALKKRAIPELMRERTHLLSAEGQRAIERVRRAIEEAPEMANATPGTRVEQVWLRLGGADCVDEAARANLDLLWSCLDRLPEGEPDLLGRALDAALEKLTALPDPNAESECGVHLMTIHKSKGLEFEVVIVPELQTRTRATQHRMIAWLEQESEQEQDSEEPSGADETTEFLVAPQQARGADKGTAKAWVDGVYTAREKEEMKRLLYVAATRAREELHLFARLKPKKEGKKEEERLAPPSNSLLAMAWPAMKNEAKKQFAAWEQAVQADATETAEAAASAPDTEKPAILHRLPADYKPPETSATTSRTEISGLGEERPYERHKGGLLSRASGTAVHALLAELARLRAANDWGAARTALRAMLPRTAAGIRAGGADAAQAEKIAAEALELVLRASEDGTVQWILSPHTDAASEARWTGVVDGRLRTVQADRVFRAAPKPGPEPGSAPDSKPHAEGNNVWWIVDYKTAETSQPDAAALEKLREFFSPQLALYARVLRLMRGPETRVCAGLYYPKMRKFDWWEA
jgi:ATP-dependent helicase/nuclease subunit A